MKFNKWTLGLVISMTLALFTIPVTAQTNGLSLAAVTALLNNGVITPGQPFTVNGITGLVTTNAAGNMVVSISGAAGTVTTTPPTTTSEAFSQAQAMIAANNPTNSNYYGTNELVARLGAVYVQSSGQALIEIGAEKYGLLKSFPQLGFGAALFQGNQNGKQSTAGVLGFFDYRRIIGDVSAQAGIGGGYDNWNKTACGAVKFDIEYRKGPHLGVYTGIAYVLEKTPTGSTSTGNNGLMVRGGVNYAF